MLCVTFLCKNPSGTLPKVQYWYLRGKALNVLPDHSPEAEQCLSRAIKHDPSLVDAWNALGECYWKAGNVQQAYDCFTGALMHVSSCAVLEFVHLETINPQCWVSFICRL